MGVHQTFPRTGRTALPTPAGGQENQSEFAVALAGLRPRLHSFARSLGRDADAADDLVQETMLRAWAARDSFQAGTNLRAWAFTILRNVFFSSQRRARFHGDYDEVAAERRLAADENQTRTVELAQVMQAIERLPESQRDALILVAIQGMSYEDVASASGTPVGTVKSRVGRARVALQGLLDADQRISARPVIEEHARSAPGRRTYEIMREQAKKAGRALMIG